MPESYRAQFGKQPPFVVTTYRADAAGNLQPDLPDQCPIAATAGRSESCCKLVRDHDRHRKTGPGHPLRVVRCLTHGIAFTLYPPGFAPYRRQPVAVVAPDGSQIDTDEVSTLKARFGGTLFDAALDAREATPWPRESGGERPDRCWATQGRHLEVASRLVGIAAGLADRTREAIAGTLAIDMLTLREIGQTSGAEAKGYRALGESIGAILMRLRGAAFAAVALLRCGHWAGQWGEPLHWDSKRRLYDRSPFPVPRTAPSP